MRTDTRARDVFLTETNVYLCRLCQNEETGSDALRVSIRARDVLLIVTETYI